MAYKTEKVPMYHEFYQNEGTAVQGTWAWAADVGQTDYASVTGEGAGSYLNNTITDADEYKWSNIYLTKGTYKLTIITIKGINGGIAEILFGTTSLGTVDMYGVLDYNYEVTITFTLQADNTADFRFKVNGKNPGSGAYAIRFSRFVLEKTG